MGPCIGTVVEPPACGRPLCAIADDGFMTMTSPVVVVCHLDDRLLVYTRNSRYVLLRENKMVFGPRPR